MTNTNRPVTEFSHKTSTELPQERSEGLNIDPTDANAVHAAADFMKFLLFFSIFPIYYLPTPGLCTTYDVMSIGPIFGFSGIKFMVEEEISSHVTVFPV